jgi:hypothetical protein
VATANLDSVPLPGDGARGRLLEDEAVVVLPARGEVKVLNEVGARIWSLADGSRSVREIAAAISAAYVVTTAEAEADTLAFLIELERKGIIQFR